MNSAQELWLTQARSDFEVFDRLRGAGVAECHLLHYLQMATEKLSKAYLWRSGKAPPKSHTGLLRFLKALLDRPPADLERIARDLGFARPQDLERWVIKIQPLAYALQSLAPAEAQDGPNPEYPWPHDSPRHCPASHSFPLWTALTATGQGRKLIQAISRAIRHFPAYG